MLCENESREFGCPYPAFDALKMPVLNFAQSLAYILYSYLLTCIIFRDMLRWGSESRARKASTNAQPSPYKTLNTQKCINTKDFNFL